ncbi:hypothetical protein B0H11DRAFT_1940402 [Mycena galericulata]|nr:hypothetical protein B0H11DRAFT_1940402 [Mycena galericulata]
MVQGDLQTSLHPSMLPTIIRHDSPHSQAQPPPAPVVMLFSATDLHLPTLPALMIHEDLHMKAEPAASAPDTERKSSKVVAFTGPQSQSTPNPDHPLRRRRSEDESEASLGDKITAPTAVCRQNIKKHPEWIETLNRRRKSRCAYIKKLADSMLDKTRAFTNQNKHKVKQVYQQRREDSNQKQILNTLSDQVGASQQGIRFEEILDKLEKLRWYGIELDTRFDSDKYKDNLCRYVSTQKHDTFGAPYIKSLNGL